MNPIENFEAQARRALTDIAQSICSEWCSGLHKGDEAVQSHAELELIALTAAFTENARLLGEQVIDNLSAEIILARDMDEDGGRITAATIKHVAATQRQALHKLTEGGEE